MSRKNVLIQVLIVESGGLAHRHFLFLPGYLPPFERHQVSRICTSLTIAA